MAALLLWQACTQHYLSIQETTQHALLHGHAVNCLAADRRHAPTHVALGLLDHPHWVISLWSVGLPAVLAAQACRPVGADSTHMCSAPLDATGNTSADSHHAAAACCGARGRPPLRGLHNPRAAPGHLLPTIRLPPMRLPQPAGG